VVRPYGIDEMVRTGKVALHRNLTARISGNGVTLLASGK